MSGVRVPHRPLFFSLLGISAIDGTLLFKSCTSYFCLYECLALIWLHLTIERSKIATFDETIDYEDPSIDDTSRSFVQDKSPTTPPIQNTSSDIGGGGQGFVFDLTAVPIQTVYAQQTPDFGLYSPEELLDPDFRTLGEEALYKAMDHESRKQQIRNQDPLASVGGAFAEGLWEGAKDVATSETPFIAQGRAGYEIWTGQDLITGEQLSGWDRALRTLDFIPVIGNDARRSLGAVDDVYDAAKRLDDVGDAAGGANDALRRADFGVGHHGAPDAVEGLSDKPSLSAHKKALKKVHEEVGKQPKGKPGKLGSPQAGIPKKGYRLDPPHPNAKPGTPEADYHFIWWGFTKGKRGKGGRSGGIPIEE